MGLLFLLLLDVRRGVTFGAVPTWLGERWVWTVCYSCTRHHLSGGICLLSGSGRLGQDTVMGQLERGGAMAAQPKAGRQADRGVGSSGRVVEWCF